MSDNLTLIPYSHNHDPKYLARAFTIGKELIP
ncbi:MAG: hypothetical protein K1060chlam5_01135 [Candidatus Anoxychlamydiales bacterium]|nr:hypothetical protein [Candidatus Anoxychlamydiales bacterium]